MTIHKPKDPLKKAGLTLDNILRSGGMPISNYYTDCNDLQSVVKQFFQITDHDMSVNALSDFFGAMLSSPYYKSSARHSEGDFFHYMLMLDFFIRIQQYVGPEIQEN